MTPRKHREKHQDDYVRNLATSYMYKHIRQLVEAVRLRTQQPNTMIMNYSGEYSSI